MTHNGWTAVKSLIAGLAIIFMVGCSTTDSNDAMDTPVMQSNNLTVVKAEVVAIDYDTRFITLKAENGQTLELHVDDKVRNFENTKVGDFLEVDYLQSMAVFVGKSDGEAPAISEGGTLRMTKDGAKPGVMATDTITITAEVESIDYKARTVVLRGPDNINRKLPVDKRVEGFEDVKKGDKVTVKYTTAIAIGVATKTKPNM